MVRHIFLIVNLMMMSGMSIALDARELVRKADEHSRGNTSVYNPDDPNDPAGMVTRDDDQGLDPRTHGCPHPHTIPTSR